jgi:DNA-binding CsgD family transcriptional regulator
MLRTSLAGLSSSSPVRSIPIRIETQPVRHVAHVVPVRRSAYDIFYKAAAILIVTTVRAEAGDPAVLQVLFDLTHAEAVLARRIAMGQQLEHIATETGRSVATLRNQLASLFAKTGCSRQAELAIILNGLVPAGR